MTTETKNEREKNLEKKHKQKQTNTQSIVPIMEHHIFKTSWTGENAQFVWQKKKKVFRILICIFPQNQKKGNPRKFKEEI